MQRTEREKMLYTQNSIIKFIFFGNYFYGLCAVALSVEANLQQHFPLNELLFYILSFIATIIYYTVAYINVGVFSRNKRLVWYYHNRQFIKKSQQLFFMIVLLILLKYLEKYWAAIWHLYWYEWLLIASFPMVAGFYYGIGYKPGIKINLRSIGWLKPFIIGFTWAGLVTVYPIFILHFQANTHYAFTWIGAFLFLKNMMFVSVLCIMFDIKDYADDYNQNLKTFVTRFGLRKTIFNILLPLAVIGLGCFLIYGYMHSFSITKIIINTLPFIAMLRVAYSLSNRHSIFYYLIIIDGLMLFKAICGIIAVIYF